MNIFYRICFFFTISFALTHCTKDTITEYKYSNIHDKVSNTVKNETDNFLDKISEIDWQCSGYERSSTRRFYQPDIMTWTQDGSSLIYVKDNGDVVIWGKRKHSRLIKGWGEGLYGIYINNRAGSILFGRKRTRIDSLEVGQIKEGINELNSIKLVNKNGLENIVDWWINDDDLIYLWVDDKGYSFKIYSLLSKNIWEIYLGYSKPKVFRGPEEYIALVNEKNDIIIVNGKIKEIEKRLSGNKYRTGLLSWSCATKTILFVDYYEDYSERISSWEVNSPNNNRKIIHEKPIKDNKSEMHGIYDIGLRQTNENEIILLREGASLFVYNVEDGKETRLSEGKKEVLGRISWQPNGDKIAIIMRPIVGGDMETKEIERRNKLAGMEIWNMKKKKKELSKVGEDWNILDIAWTPDGNKMAIITNAKRNEPYVYDAIKNKFIPR